MLSPDHNLETARQLHSPPKDEIVSFQVAPKICREAEPRLAQSLLHRMFIVVNDLMLVKGFGDILGMPLEQPTLTDSDTGIPRDIQPHVWYRPFQLTREKAIKQACRAGETAIDLPGTTTWIESRPIDVGRVYPACEDLAAIALGIFNDRAQYGTNLPPGTNPTNCRYTFTDLPEDVDLTAFWSRYPNVTDAGL